MTVIFVVERIKGGLGFSKVAGQVLSGTLDANQYYRAAGGTVFIALLGDAMAVDSLLTFVKQKGQVTPQMGGVTLYVSGKQRRAIFEPGRTVTLEPVAEPVPEKVLSETFGSEKPGKILSGSDAQKKRRAPRKPGPVDWLWNIIFLGFVLWWGWDSFAPIFHAWLPAYFR